uniref:Distal membrane-arm assembly complex protein 1-like domain-containing protein n=1 Tax=Laticauda laticaudata TaxID=8630 RepID=A0A8C5STX6_LATLA
MATFPSFREAGIAASGTEAAILLDGNMATQPGGGAVAGSSKATPQKSFWSCFICRMLTGSGLAGAGLWVHLGVRRSLPYSHTCKCLACREELVSPLGSPRGAIT